MCRAKCVVRKKHTIETIMEILPSFYLGNEVDSQQMIVDVVINCTSNIPFTNHREENLQIRIPVEDNGDASEVDKLFELLRDRELMRRIALSLKERKTVLVHCRMGQQRSAAVVAAFLMFSLRLNPSAAIDFIKSRKRDAFLYNTNFQNALDRLFGEWFVY